MKITSKAGAFLKSASATVLPFVSGNRKSGAAVPSGSIVEGVNAIYPFLIRCVSYTRFNSIQSAREPCPLQNRLSQRAGFGGRVCEDLVDVIQIRSEFGPFSAGGGEVIPIMFKQRLFQVAVTQSTRAQAVLKIG